MLMLCRNPYQKGEALYPCGQCLPCRINRRRVWTHRILLEAMQHGCSAFVTLTYRDDNIPTVASGSSVTATLDPTHAQNWIKRLRRTIEPLRIRYYLVGEYGDASGRPHYHAVLFGHPTCRYGRTRHKEECCDVCDAIRNTWGFGHIVAGDLTKQSAAYVAGYVLKKLGDGASRFANSNRYPEFARMSLRPGIGGDAMWDVASTILAFGIEDRGDVPGTLRHGSRELPLGRYLRRRLRTYVGKEEAAPAETIEEARQELSALWEAAQGAPSGIRGSIYRSSYLDATENRYLQMVNRRGILKEHETL